MTVLLAPAYASGGGSRGRQCDCVAIHASLGCDALPTQYYHLSYSDRPATLSSPPWHALPDATRSELSGKMGARQAVQTAMAQHAEDPDVQIACCRILVRLALNGTRGRRTTLARHARHACPLGALLTLAVGACR